MIRSLSILNDFWIRLINIDSDLVVKILKSFTQGQLKNIR